MKETRYIDTKTRQLLFKRSKGLCECCGIDISPDKHHIYEFAKGGKGSYENLIVLCPSCHRQIPAFLSQKQQHELQSWHQNNLYGNRSIGHQIFSQFNQFKIGSNLYLGCTRILVIDEQNIITPYLKGDRFYLNVIMLGSFSPKLLILANRIIVNDNDLVLSTSSNIATIKDQNEGIFTIEKEDDNLINITLNFKYKNHDFIFTEQHTSFPGFVVSNCTFRVKTAIIYNSNGPRILGSSQ